MSYVLCLNIAIAVALKKKTSEDTDQPVRAVRSSSFLYYLSLRSNWAKSETLNSLR